MRRAHRFGQQRPVHVIKLAVKDTVEAKIINEIHGPSDASPEELASLGDCCAICRENLDTAKVLPCGPSKTKPLLQGILFAAPKTVSSGVCLSTISSIVCSALQTRLALLCI